MWQTLRGVVSGKAVVLTTRESLISIMTKSVDLRPLDSMEEASALANKVGILAKKMLAVGTTDALVDRYARYEVHFSCRTREEVVPGRYPIS